MVVKVEPLTPTRVLPIRSVGWSVRTFLFEALRDLSIAAGAALELGLGLAAVLAPNLLTSKHREASAPKQ